MIEASRRAYLEALGFQNWVLKPAAPLQDRLLLGPGDSRVLLVAETAGDSATPLAADIARAFGEEPVWAWPDPAAAPQQPGLDQAIGAGLFTLVILFGNRLAKRLLGTHDRDVIASASIMITETLASLEVSPAARRDLWSQIAPQLRAGRLDGSR